MTGESLRALALIFTIPLIMAQTFSGGKFSEKNILPVYLDDAIQVVSTASDDWDGKTSRIHATVNEACALTIGDGTIAGQLLTIMDDRGSGNTHNLTITFTTGPMGDDAELDVITLNATGEFATAMWTGSNWIFLGAGGGVSVA